MKAEAIIGHVEYLSALECYLWQKLYISLPLPFLYFDVPIQQLLFLKVREGFSKVYKRDYHVKKD